MAGSDVISNEIVWIMMAQRAARGLGSLYAHANELTMKEAGQIHMDYTPRGWMKTEEKLLLFEQHLYLRQPGYGTSYITGKYLLERTLAEYGKVREEQDEKFSLKAFLQSKKPAPVISLKFLILFIKSFIFIPKLF